jgi:hypothetical protein
MQSPLPIHSLLSPLSCFKRLINVWSGLNESPHAPNYDEKSQFLWFSLWADFMDGNLVILQYCINCLGSVMFNKILCKV